MTKSPYNNQGHSIPLSFGIKGHWIKNNEYFIFEGSEVTAEFRSLRGHPALGFSASRLAKQMGISSTELFSGNQSGHLSIGIIGEPETAGNATIVTYGFALGSLIAIVRIESVEKNRLA
jgi:hypothetical protein